MIAVSVLAGAAAHPEPAVEFGRIFTDDMVLQRGTKAPVWGMAPAGSRVRVTFAGQVHTARADAKGRWAVKLDPLLASCAGRALAAGTENGTNVLTDVLVGEVWLAAGQSNMNWPVSRCRTPPPARNRDLIRMCNLEGTVGDDRGLVYGPSELARLRPEAFYAGTWQTMERDAIRAQSGVAFFFADALAGALRGAGPDGGDVPIGIVELAYGGTSTEAYIPPAVLRADPVLRPAFEDPRGTDTLGQWTSARIARNLGGYEHTAPALPHPHPYAPGFLYWTGVAEIAPLAVRGAIWYQGESNAEFTEGRYDWPGEKLLEHQARVMRTLIVSWRRAFGRADLPFYMVQLPGINAPNRVKWPWYREAQRRVARDTAGVELAVAPEFGADGPNVHPPDKAPVGRRLAYLARRLVYGEEIPSSGPRCVSCALDGNQAVLRFENVEEGLIAVDGNPLREFEVAGDDRVFVPASARIAGDTVVVGSPRVPRPQFVRHGWHMNLDINLYNSNNVENLPAEPFRLRVRRRQKGACHGTRTHR